MKQGKKVKEGGDEVRFVKEETAEFRAIVVPMVNLGGFLAVLAGMSGHGLAVPWWQLWGTVLTVMVIFGVTSMVRRANVKKKSVFSPRLKEVLRAILPPLVTGGLVGVLLLAGTGGEGNGVVASLWMMFYGLALMATGSILPRSVWMLGAAFVIAGIACFASFSAVSPRFASVLMGATFGIFHVGYGLWLTMIKKGH